MKLGRLLVPEVGLRPARRRLAAVPDHRHRGAEDVGRPAEFLGSIGDGHRAAGRTKNALSACKFSQVARQTMISDHNSFRPDTHPAKEKIGQKNSMTKKPPVDFRGHFLASPPPRELEDWRVGGGDRDQEPGDERPG